MKPTPLALLRAFATVLVLLVAGCATTPAPAPTPPLVLVSLDGFRWDYLDKYAAECPTLRQLAHDGCTATQLVPVYPSNTFPNHYTIATGLYPAHHGLINNDMFDPPTGLFFHSNQPKSVHESMWFGGEPIWVTAIKQGHTAACSFWVGSEAAIEGVYPTYWKPYDLKRNPFESRLEELAGWMKMAPEQRPLVTTFYLEETNSVGHKFGPDSPEMAKTVKMMDDRIAAMLARFKAEKVAVNLIVVSDHGMTHVSGDRVVVFDDYLDMSTVQVDFFGSIGGLRPLDGTPESIVRALSALPHAHAVLSKDLPERFHLKGNPRIPPVWIMMDEGWEIDTRRHLEAIRAHYNPGDHGFDNAFESMHGILIASGPSFKNGERIPSVENIHIYNLLCAAAGLKAAPNDGDDRLVRAFLRP